MSNSGNGAILVIMGTGIATKDLEEGQLYLDVNPSQSVVPDADMPIDKTKDVKSKYTDSKGNKQSANKKVGLGLKMPWLSMNSNRALPPTVVKGMEVFIWKNILSNDYYWSSWDGQEDLIPQEQALFLFSNLKKPQKVPRDQKNSWAVGISPKTGELFVHTTNNNGEKAVFKFDFSTKTGKAIMNVNGSSVEISAGEITFNTANVVFNSNVTINGNLNSKGNSKFNEKGFTVTDVPLK